MNKLPNYALLIQDINKQLLKEKKYSNIYEIPRLKKVVITSCQTRNKGKITKDKEAETEYANNLNYTMDILYRITGQIPVFCKAKKSIANFGLRKTGINIAAKVTLRNNIMFEFVHRLSTIYLPRSRTLNFISKKSITNNTLSIGLNDLTIFIEIPLNYSLNTKGLTVTFCFERHNKKPINKDEIMFLLSKFNMPVDLD